MSGDSSSKCSVTCVKPGGQEKQPRVQTKSQGRAEEQGRGVLAPLCVAAECCWLPVAATGRVALAAPTNAASACTKLGCEVCMGFGKHNVILIINYLET